MVIDTIQENIIIMAVMEDAISELLSILSIVGDFNLNEAIHTGQGYVHCSIYEQVIIMLQTNIQPLACFKIHFNSRLALFKAGWPVLKRSSNICALHCQKSSTNGGHRG